MAIDGMLDQLHDPYSVFLKRDDFRALSEATTGNYGGLGIQIDVRDGWITVVAPLPETPAERAGIQSGDRIVVLDGRSTEGWKNDQAVKELRGQPGTPVELRVRRVGVEQPLTFKMTRATIHIRSVPVAMMLDDRVGYVQLNPVSETSTQDLGDAIAGLLKKGMKSLWQLTPEAALKLTTARWYTPSGRTIQRKSKSEADQEAQVVAAEEGRDTTQPDSTLIFHTDHGRVVVGGGGIRPDLFISPDTFTTAERNFMKSLGSNIPTYWDVRSTYALEAKASGRMTDPNFSVTQEMIDDVLRRLRARKVTIPDSLVAGARPLIAQDLGYEIARYVFGRPVEVRRRMTMDRQVQTAVALAHRARSPEDLLALAAAQASASPRN